MDTPKTTQITAEQYAKFKPIIRAAAFKVGGKQVSKADMEDIVQSVVCELMTRKLAQYTPAQGMQLTTFVSMVAHNYVVDMLRRRKPQHTGVSEDGDSLVESAMDHQAFSDGAGVESDALSMLLRQEQGARVMAALRSLSGEDQVFIERIMDIGPQELALQMGCKPSNLYVRRHKIIKKLKAMLASDDAS